MRTVADDFNQYHTQYVKPNMDKKIEADDLADYAKKEDIPEADLSEYAKIESPEFTGVAKVPTPDNDTDSEQIASTEFCQNLIRRLLGATPETLDTLAKLATALNNDPNFAETVVQALDNKLNKSDAENTYMKFSTLRKDKQAQTIILRNEWTEDDDSKWQQLVIDSDPAAKYFGINISMPDYYFQLNRYPTSGTTLQLKGNLYLKPTDGHVYAGNKQLD